VNGSYRNFATRIILCAVSMLDTSLMVASFAAELAAQHNARLILQHVIRPQERSEVLASRSIDQIEGDLMAMIPDKLQEKIDVQAMVVPGDPTEELLYQCSAQQADLIVLGAQGASTFAAITRHGIVYKVLAHAQCPVLTLSPVVLAQSGATGERISSIETFLAGVI
jgi:nucleotide-binding universal stress UspA family protein